MHKVGRLTLVKSNAVSRPTSKEVAWIEGYFSVILKLLYFQVFFDFVKHTHMQSIAIVYNPLSPKGKIRKADLLKMSEPDFLFSQLKKNFRVVDF